MRLPDLLLIDEEVESAVQDDHVLFSLARRSAVLLFADPVQFQNSLALHQLTLTLRILIFYFISSGKSAIPTSPEACFQKRSTINRNRDRDKCFDVHFVSFKLFLIFLRYMSLK